MRGCKEKAFILLMVSLVLKVLCFFIQVLVNLNVLRTQTNLNMMAISASLSFWIVVSFCYIVVRYYVKKHNSH